MEAVSRFVVLKLLEHNCIKQEDYEACKYGLKVFFTSICELLFILLISIFMNNFSGTVFWLMAFIPLRIYSGGYHADTRLRCFLILIGVYLAFSLCLKTINLSLWNGVLIGCLTVVCTCIFAPLKHKNKNLSENEIKFYRYVAIAISIIECIILLVLLNMLKTTYYINAFALGMFTSTVSLLLGKLKNMIRR